MDNEELLYEEGGKQGVKLGPKLSSIILLMELTKNLEGEVWECGVYQGQTSRWLGFMTSVKPKTVRLFDTFEGRADKTGPDTGTSDFRFLETSLEKVKKIVPWDFVEFHKGLIPNTFVGLEDCKVAFAYLDLDLYQPTVDSLNFILPRLVKGGVILLDDFETEEWPGISKAVVDVLHPEKFEPLRNNLLGAGEKLEHGEVLEHLYLIRKLGNDTNISKV